MELRSSISLQKNPVISSTILYGKSSKELKSEDLDMAKEVDYKILDYRISQITAELKTNEGIQGIAIKVCNRNTGEEKTLINRKGQGTPMDYKFGENEHIIDVKVWSKNRKFTGFEIITNKGNKKFGIGAEGESMQISDLADGKKIVVGFCFAYSPENGITGMSCYYLDKKEYTIKLYSGMLFLKLKIKDQAFKEETERNLGNLDSEMNVVYKICSLPNNQFFGVMKYAFD